MIETLIFIFGGSLLYVSLLRLTSGENIQEQENNRRRLTVEYRRQRRQPRNCSW